MEIQTCLLRFPTILHLWNNGDNNKARRRSLWRQIPFINQEFLDGFLLFLSFWFFTEKTSIPKYVSFHFSFGDWMWCLFVTTVTLTQCMRRTVHSKRIKMKMKIFQFSAVWYEYSMIYDRMNSFFRPPYTVGFRYYFYFYFSARWQGGHWIFIFPHS